MKPLRSSFYFGVFFLLLLGLLFGLGVLLYLYFPFSHATEASATERNTTGVQPATQKRHEWYDKYENDRYLSRLGFFKNLDKETYEEYLKILEEDINTESAVTTRTIADKSNEARGNGSITGTETQEEKILPGMIPSKQNNTLSINKIQNILQRLYGCSTPWSHPQVSCWPILHSSS